MGNSLKQSPDLVLLCLSVVFFTARRKKSEDLGCLSHERIVWSRELCLLLLKTGQKASLAANDWEEAFVLSEKQRNQNLCHLNQYKKKQSFMSKGLLLNV